MVSRERQGVGGVRLPYSQFLQLKLGNADAASSGPLRAGRGPPSAYEQMHVTSHNETSKATRPSFVTWSPARGCKVKEYNPGNRAQHARLACPACPRWRLRVAGLGAVRG